MVAARPDLQPWHRRAERLVEEGADFITAGFPCQDISFAGAGAGLAGARSGLVWQLLRTIRLVRPRGALLENVAALLGRGLGDILGHLAAVRYDAEWHCIPASAVGAPHRRDRIWIFLTDAGGEQHEGRSAPISGEIAAQLFIADTNSPPVLGPEIFRCEPHGDPANAEERPAGRELGGSGLSQGIRDANVSGLAIGQGQSRDVGEEFAPAFGTDWWGVEPDVGRVAHGVPARVDRLRCLGNAVVPQIPELIGKAFLEAEGMMFEEASLE
jgi:DNA (cytosine-5)-methyltransferase 1